MIPSLNGSNGESPEPSGRSSNSDPPANHICPICGASFSQKYEVACHFVTCVDQHGNPDGARWDDCTSITGQTPTSQQVIRQTATPQQRPQTLTPIPPLRYGPHYVSKRKTKFNNRLNAVNGVVIPSKLPAVKPAHSPPSKPGSSILSQLSCPLCKCSFARRDHIRSHFPACVDRNGNPDGLRWDDGVPKFSRGPRGPKRLIQVGGATGGEEVGLLDRVS